MRIFKVCLNRESGYTITREDITVFLEDLDYLEPGNILSIECIEITRKQYEKLPEFQGW